MLNFAYVRCPIACKTVKCTVRALDEQPHAWSITWGLCPQTPGVYRIGPMGIVSIGSSPVLLRLCCLVLLRLCLVLLRPRQEFRWGTFEQRFLWDLFEVKCIREPACGIIQRDLGESFSVPLQPRIRDVGEG